MEKKMLLYSALLAGFMSLVVFSSFLEKEPADSSVFITDSTSLNQHIKSFDLSKNFNLAGERVPADNFDAIERLDRELLVNAYTHASTLLHIKTANRYFPIIEPILAAHGIPDDFKYLCVAESSLRMAISPAGAKGLWQFVNLMGHAYDLTITDEVDERYHVEKSTVAACKFLLYLKNRFGSWTMAAAAYNMGETSLAKRATEQKSNNYYDLNLNDETSRYVFRIIAIKEILQHPEEYGFHIETDHLYDPHDYTTVQVKQPIYSLSEFAQQHGTTYRMIKVLNPWLISTSLKNIYGKKYEIRIPKP